MNRRTLLKSAATLVGAVATSLPREALATELVNNPDGAEQRSIAG